MALNTIAGEAICPDCGREVGTYRHCYAIHARLKPVAPGMVSTRTETCPAVGMPVVTEETFRQAERNEYMRGYGN